MAVPQPVGAIANHVHTPEGDEQQQIDEGEGPFVLADARDAAAWLGTGIGPRWKTWCLGDITGLPLQWPRFDRFHGDEASAERSRQLLREAIAKSVQNVRFDPPQRNIGKHPASAFDLVMVGQDDGSFSGPLGVVMKEVCSDHDYAMHAVFGLSGITAGSPSGPKVVGYRPPPSVCTVATVTGINDRADHVVFVFSPGDLDVKKDLAACLPGAGPDGQHQDVTIDVMSGVLVAFWSRIPGKDVVAPFGADPAMGLATGPLAGGKLAAPLSSGSQGLDRRLPGPPAWAFLVNPGRWTARYWYKDTPDGAGLSCCVFSRVGSASWQPNLPDGFGPQQALPPNPMEATKAAMSNAAADMATDYARNAVIQQVKQYVPKFLWPLIPGVGGSVGANVQKAASDYMWQTIGGCVFSLIFFGLVAVVLVGVALVILAALISG